ncbi:DUF1800 domain-containing protein [Edaphobacter modestus]|uniref:Uncharacterized protein DUF1800 n=1 Tax=Edaphobacter modestus TaxID=388466 RepID=A0A4Q7YZQ0_9BACT|nr:DUF1800 domain-containing protein [Edaphobacter modestus]RZU43472.1 uncharacterized protein DUF1800 [Edaphobacter modestus]
MRVVFTAILALAVTPLQAQSDPAAKQRPKPSAHARAAKSRSSVSPKQPISIPLNQRERTTQILNRFTFGPRPGDVDRVLALGADKWFEQQLNPDSITDDALNKRLAAYPTLTMTPEQALTAFPDRATIKAVADEKLQPPADPSLAAVYEVQLVKLNQQETGKRKDAGADPADSSANDPHFAEQVNRDRAAATHIAGELFALPKEQRMAALIKLPVADRIAFTTYVSGEQRGLLLSQFTPRERELFNAMAANINSSSQIVTELSQAKVLRAILSERQVQEVMTDFWFNHFNVFIGKNSDQWYTTSYERDVIRKNALGKFRDLLLATATSPAMMVYLDNWQSVGPNSIANGVNPARPNAKKGNRGLNENYGRELMELHTVGVDGGYTQADVTALSAILTGWTVDRPHQAGLFVFEPRRHEPGPKQWMGHKMEASTVSDQTGMKEGIQALTLLAASPATAHFVSFKLAQRFVADDPPPALVDRMAATWLSTDGDIKAILRTMVESPEFNSRGSFRSKVKTPFEFVASAFRTTATDPVNPGALVQTLKTMGMQPYYALPPTGYAITADRWMNSSALVARLNFAYLLTSGKFPNQKFDSEHVLAIGLMSQPSIVAAGTSKSTQPVYRKAAFAAVPGTSGSAVSGQDFALSLLESSLVGGDLSAQTNELIHQQLGKLITPSSAPTDSLNLLMALVMGSPEFQMR